jgi:hypothetical protein
MCVDVILYECGDYRWHQRVGPCSHSLSEGTCSRQLIYEIVTRDRPCAKCVTIERNESYLRVKEEQLRRFKEQAADKTRRVLTSEQTAALHTMLAKFENAISEQRSQLENARIERQKSLMGSEGTELGRGIQVLSIVKFGVEEMRAVLMSDDN